MKIYRMCTKVHVLHCLQSYWHLTHIHIMLDQSCEMKTIAERHFTVR